MPNILTIGSALVDIFIHSPEFEFSSEQVVLSKNLGSGKLPVGSFELTTGGGATNTAVAFARFGYTASIISELGYDQLGDMVLADLRAEGVETKHIVREKREETGGSVILVAEDGERVALVHRGAAAMIDPKDLNPKAFWRTDWIHVSSLGGQTKTLQELGKIVAEKHLRVSWNPGDAEITALIKGDLKFQDLPIEVLFVNQQEWELLAPLHDYIQQNISITVITAGGDGGRVITKNDGEKTFTSQATTVVETTGAGDAFASGFVAGFLHFENLDKAIDLATRNSAGVVAKVGAKAGLLRKLD